MLRHSDTEKTQLCTGRLWAFRRHIVFKCHIIDTLPCSVRSEQPQWNTEPQWSLLSHNRRTVTYCLRTVHQCVAIPVWGPVPRRETTSVWSVDDTSDRCCYAIQKVLCTQSFLIMQHEPFSYLRLATSFLAPNVPVFLCMCREELQNNDS